ncbi:unnamed protein product [Dovyalis caffra]|uniref:Uncharacterized protein n=1 Tax=Dovyalis caffra TaxID=77055 RepID=A0AAV1R8L0_9ROSI|nr:unnamed protein product [Dovyalis caffra]
MKEEALIFFAEGAGSDHRGARRVKLGKAWINLVPKQDILSIRRKWLNKGQREKRKKSEKKEKDKYSLISFPSNFPPENLVEVNLSFSEVEELWEGIRRVGIKEWQPFVKVPSNYTFGLKVVTIHIIYALMHPSQKDSTAHILNKWWCASMSFLISIVE